MDKRNILLFDIETFPNIGYCWGKWEQNIIEFVKEWELASFAYKWLGHEEVICKSRPDYSDLTDKSLVTDLWCLFEQAEIIIAHNGDSFDNKKSKAKFIEHGLNPPAPYKTIDTKKIAKSQFKFESNSLNDLGVKLGLGEKQDTGGFKLWKGCMAGDKESWNTMTEYNKQDVVLLEKVYLRLRPWMPNHPNISQLEGRIEGCPSCGSKHTQKRGFVLLSKGQKKQRSQCQDCGKWFV